MDELLLKATAGLIRDRRILLGLTQSELGKRTGFHRAYIADLEKNGRNVSVANFSRLAEALNFEKPSLFAKAAEKRALQMRATKEQRKRTYMTSRTIQPTKKHSEQTENRLSRNSTIVRTRRIVKPASVTQIQLPSTAEPISASPAVTTPELAFGYLPDLNYSDKVLEMSRLAKVLQCDVVTELGQQKVSHTSVKTDAYLTALSAILKERREQLGISQDQLCERIGIDRTYLRLIKRDHKNLSFDMFLRFAFGLELDLHELIRQLVKRVSDEVSSIQLVSDSRN